MAEKNSAKKNIAGIIRENLEDKINGLGYDVWDIEYVKEGPDYHLRFTIDSENGIDIDDCEKVHRFIDPLLDEYDLIEDSYILEVSSPGVERNIRTPEHYKAMVGNDITIKLFTAVDGQKQITGKLVSYNDDESITLQKGDAKSYIIPLSSVSRANLYYNFDD